MNNDVYYSLVLACGFLILFTLSEVLYRLFHVGAEYTRKLTHVATGFITLLFPLLLSSHWYVLLLCGSFFVILVLSLRFRFLPSINNIDRKSRGSLSYPVAVYGCFYVYTFFDHYVFFYLPVVILAVADPVAALVGKKYPKGRYVLLNDPKTLAGSAAFLACATIVSYILLKTLTPLSEQEIFLTAAGIASLTTLAEAVTQKGYDNLTIPFTAVIALVGKSCFWAGI